MNPSLKIDTETGQTDLLIACNATEEGAVVGEFLKNQGLKEGGESAVSLSGVDVEIVRIGENIAAINLMGKPQREAPSKASETTVKIAKPPKAKK